LLIFRNAEGVHGRESLGTPITDEDTRTQQHTKDTTRGGLH